MAEEKSTTSFLSYHLPALQAGSFVIEQEMIMPSGLSDTAVEIPVARQHFVVLGERFFISPGHVFATFPPKDSQGDYTGCLPHIELTRSTFPWERNVSKGNDQAATGAPWLALLMVSEDDIAAGDVAEATINADEYVSKNGLTKEPVQIQGTDAISILKCKAAYLNSHLPALADLKLLAHVRKVNNKDDVAMAHIPRERAVIVSRSIPNAGKRYTVHLVSLEERFENGKFLHKPDAEQMDSLASLYSWSFTATGNENYKPDTLALYKLKTKAEEKGGLAKLGLQKQQFDKIYDVLNTNLQKGTPPLLRSSERFKAYLKEEDIFPDEIDTIITPAVLECFQYEAATLRSLLNNLQVGPLKLMLPQETNNAGVSDYLDFGSVPLPHYLRAGGNTVSWYRGPFVAYDATFDEDHGKIHTYQHADELIQFNKDTGLLDMTYAAAWELGRLMFINEPKLVQQLQLWKQENNFDDILEKQRQEYEHLVGFIAQPKNEPLPAAIVRFLFQSFRFINFPFNYLVPDKRLLPKESLRFFKVDEVWLRSFLYGVISVGERISLKKTESVIIDIRKQLRTEIGGIIKEKDYYTNESNSIYGVLISSEAVSGWPALQVEAYNYNNGAPKQIALLHKSYVSDDVMLCLFYGKVEQVVMYLPMGASHFGFGVDEATGGFSKTLADGKTQLKPFSGNIIDAVTLSSQMLADSSGSFAVELLHKQDMVMFDIKQV